MKKVWPGRLDLSGGPHSLSGRLGAVSRRDAHLAQSVKLIHHEGLLWRMPDSADQLLCGMNKICIRMTHTCRKKGAVKARKTILRKMKKLLKRIGAHALRHRDLLEARFGQTRLSRGRADQVIARIDGQPDLLPRVIEQAHERIIGGRLVNNEDKILSACERYIAVIVRGKAGAQTEFGNELFIAESLRGMIIDYLLYGKCAPAEGEKLLESVGRQQSINMEQGLEAAVWSGASMAYSHWARCRCKESPATSARKVRRNWKNS